MSSQFRAAYLKTIEKGKMEAKIKAARELLRSCVLCGRKCRVNRLEGEKGFCGLTSELHVASYGPHHGEEAPLSGTEGSGTIFFAKCNLGCVFCQNFDISLQGSGRKYEVEELTEAMLHLQERGCHNINLVTPTHQMPIILEAVNDAAQKGLNLPIVWNCGGYESLEALSLLDGVIDIYMPDFKFWKPESSEKYCKAPDYPQVAKTAVKAMHRQVGDLVINEKGLAERGLLVRHLIMPENTAGTKQIIEFLAKEVSKNTYINVLAQYRPLYHAYKFKEINRPINEFERQRAYEWVKEAGLRLDEEVEPPASFIVFEI